MNKTERLTVIANLMSAARMVAIGHLNAALLDARAAVRRLEPCDELHGVWRGWGWRYCPRCGVKLEGV